MLLTYKRKLMEHLIAMRHCGRLVRVTREKSRRAWVCIQCRTRQFSVIIESETWKERRKQGYRLHGRLYVRCYCCKPFLWQPRRPHLTARNRLNKIYLWSQTHD